MRPKTPRPILLKNYQPPGYLIDKVDLDVALHPKRTRIRSRLSVRANPKVRGKREPLRLDGTHMELAEISVNRKKLAPKDYKLTDTSLTLTKTPAKPFTLEIVTFVNPEANKALQGLYRTNGVYCTQCEAEGFRHITYFLDRPDI
ncbi:MAG: aminopeptidase N, partial [Hyphomicrobiaceae bacterium]|nr:aminopeptidase N [Hyphomicrobiaceae bacterium]